MTSTRRMILPAAASWPRWMIRGRTSRSGTPGVFRASGEGRSRPRGQPAIGCSTSRAHSTPACSPGWRRRRQAPPSRVRRSSRRWPPATRPPAPCAHLCGLLDEGARGGSRVERHLVPTDAVTMELPTRIGDFTDFLTSSFHSTRPPPSGKLARKLTSTPIADHARASSVRHDDWTTSSNSVPSSGSAGPYRSRRHRASSAATACSAIDRYATFSAGRAGLSAPSPRRASRPRSRPGSLRKRPFAAPAFRRDDDAPAPLPYLFVREAERGSLDLALAAESRTRETREHGEAGYAVTETNFRTIYWTFADGGTPYEQRLQPSPGDLIGSGVMAFSRQEKRVRSGSAPSKASITAERRAHQSSARPAPNHEAGASRSGHPQPSVSRLTGPTSVTSRPLARRASAKRWSQCRSSSRASARA